MTAERVTIAESSLKPDWIVTVLPIVLAFMVFNYKITIVLIGLLIGLAFLRKAERSFHLEPGPLFVLFAACAIVYSRSEDLLLVIVLAMLAILVVRLVMTVDARRIMVSLIDGLGLYLVVNVVAHLGGMRTPTLANQRFDRVAESTGFIRTVFPLTNSINSPSIVAIVYFVGSICLLRQSSWVRRGIWLVCAAAASYVMVSAGSRAALAITAMLSIGALVFPFVSRWIAQASTVLAVVSAFILPSLISSILTVIKPLVSLTPGRDTNEYDIISLQGRDRIWEGSIRYWRERVNDFNDIMVGFGTSGQYKSGASSTYTTVVAGLTKQEEYAFVHNSFLQQLFDGGVVGFLCLAVVAYWTGRRLSRRYHQWGAVGLSAVFALTALLLGNMTEATMAPGVFQESFWLLVVIVGIACQKLPERNEDIDDTALTTGHSTNRL